jgi:hypothetical protein
VTEAVRNTQQSSGMVERVARILRKSREINCSWDDAERLARSVLEASHHTALVAHLRRARLYVAEAQEARPHENSCGLLVGIDALLAKIGGDPGISSTPRDERE